MRTFLLIDSYNLFFRAMYTCNDNDSELRKGLLLHTMFFMFKKACDKFNPDHLVICADGKGSWRYKEYPKYKANRIESYNKKTFAEQEKEKQLKDVFTNDFIPFIKEKTNVTFLQYENAEADDLIARFIELHPNDKCVIVSTDNDYIQLLNDNVIIYNTMDNRIISKNCILSSENYKPIKFTLKNGKISVSKTDVLVKKGDPLVPMKDWVEYALFTKIVRGDDSDNIFSAFPRVREKSTKNSVGMLDAFEDREYKGFNWQTFMNSTWETPLGEKKLVKECYEFNKKIIDLKEIPNEIKVLVDSYIMESLHTNYISNIGINIMKYLGKWNLQKLLDISSSFSGYFSKTYPNEKTPL